MRRSVPFPFLVLALSLALVGATGCKKKSKAAAETIAGMQGFADLMCRCKRGDRPCADQVQVEMTAWSTQMASQSGDHPAPPTEAEMKQMTKIGTRYGECMLRASESADLPPAAGTPPAERAGEPADHQR
ncbi:MAG: hypothetical protein IPQ07_12140 [Myxococcales bacterium]|nr:hypothetical protein [Myxococcales bacterium]